MKPASPRSAVSLALAALLAGCALQPAAERGDDAVAAVQTLVVIYAENRAFDTMYGLFPGANGIPGVNPSASGTLVPQKDRDGSLLPALPPVWGGLSGPRQPPSLTQAQTASMANRPFQLDDPHGINGTGVAAPPSLVTHDLVHRYYNNIMQIAGGANDQFAAWSDAGGLSMGYYDGSTMKMWDLARRYTLADNFFMGAFGGSYLNHQYLICACAPVYPDAENSPAKDLISAVDVDAQGHFLRLTPASGAEKSALNGAPRFLRDGTLTAKDASGLYYTINTMQPAFQPSGNPPAAGGDARYADRARATTMPPLTNSTIADRLDAKGISWAWYAGAWNEAASPQGRSVIYAGARQFQPHHQPFNYYAAFDPITHAAERARHLKDFDADFLADAAAGKLPAVSFYKPQGNLNQHAGYANLSDGDAHIAEVIAALQKSPQWPGMLIVVTYDENGGFWDHARVPKGDRWGPGTRIPAIIVSPLAKKAFVDKTPYDTASILRFITRRWGVAPLPGVVERDAALRAHGEPPMGDFSAALEPRH